MQLMGYSPILLAIFAILHGSWWLFFAVHRRSVAVPQPEAREGTAASRSDQGLDPVLTYVIGSHVLAIAEEMGVVLVKTAYSTNIKERADSSTAIFDTEGRTVAQASH